MKYKHTDALDDAIAMAMIQEPRLFPIRLNKTTITYIMNKKPKVHKK